MRRITASAAAPLGCGGYLFSTITAWTAADHYQRLGVEMSATSAEIKAAYRKRALECHPDVVPVAQKASAEAEFRRVSEAYSVLGDETSRKKFDARMKRQQDSDGVAMMMKRKQSTTTRRQTTTTRPPTEAPRASQQASEGSSSAFASMFRDAAPDTSSRKSSKSWATPADAASPWASSGGSGRQQRPAAAFVRKDADRLFREAFDGRTLDDVLFHVQSRERREEQREQQRKRRSASRSGNNSSSETPHPKEQQPAGHEEVMRRVMTDAAKQFAERVAKEYGYESLKHARLVCAKPAASPPGKHMPFRPFVGTTLPEGVTAVEDPVMGKVTNLEQEEVVSLHSGDRAEIDEVVDRIPANQRQTRTREVAMRRLQAEVAHPHNLGQIYSYQRPY